MREGESENECLRVEQSENSGHAVGRDKGESVGGVHPVPRRRQWWASRAIPNSPCVNFTEEAKLCLAERYREALVIKVLDKNYSYTAFSHKLRMVWRIKCGFDLLDVGFGYFMVKFDAGEDREKVMLGGPWLIEGHYVAVKLWDIDFRPCEESFGSKLVWVRISGLPFWCYQEQAMMRIASAIGVPIKVDLATKLAERGRYARVCVQINLGLPVIKHIIVEGVTHVVEYESLNLICNSCARYGHDMAQCLGRDSREGKSADSDATKPRDSTKAVPHPETKIHNSNEVEPDVVSGVTGENPAPSLQKDLEANNLEGNNVEEACMHDEPGWEQVVRKGKTKLGQKQSNKVQRGTKSRTDSDRVIRPTIHFSHTSGSSFYRARVGSRVKVGHSAFRVGETSISSTRHTPVPCGSSLRKRPRPGSLQSSPVEKNGGTVVEASSCLPTTVKEDVTVAVPLVKEGALPAVIASVCENKETFHGDPENLKVTGVTSAGQASCVTVEVQVNNVIWRCSGIYGSPQFNTRVLLWDYLVTQSSSFCGPWIVLGDFNEVLFSHESKGCLFSSCHADRFATSLGDSNLFDLKTIGRRFSWYRRVKNGVEVAKKLDRVCINSGWLSLFPEAYAEILNRLQSDHCPILVRCAGRPQPKKNRPFRFIAAWATHLEYRNIVNQSWQAGYREMHGKLSEVQKNYLLEFNSKVFGNIFVRKCKLERQINFLQKRLEVMEDLSMRQKEKQLIEEFNNTLVQEELLWFQKSREQWVKFGDRNTKFFHVQTLVRRKHNKIHGLFLQDGVWETDPDVLRREAESFYKHLFCQLEDVDLGCLGDVSLPSLNDEACCSLTAPVTLEEVKSAIFSMHSFKAPGPDGFQALFFKEYWEIVGFDVWTMVRHAFSGLDMDPRMMETLVVLIPKVENPISMKDFRPISLCNVVYKVITKVLVNRLCPHLKEIIGPLQGGFIPGRGTPDNIIVAQEVLHFMKKTKSKKGTLAFKIDLEKAYDRVDWGFLKQTLVSFGFPPPTVNLIMRCVTASSLSILWNGDRLNSFIPSRGLRQGDPISPYLFVLCMERLSCSINQQVDKGLWTPVAISRGGPRISHLMFADDLLLFCKAEK
ncbi:uncharacterized protein LOC130948905 [Arachis stenosperma]|uniref:uncharacterized protein LOC130948905 n=1 Tax=Arachis stenosperma TaxID=217475 RepID=UPI0025ACB6DB|nr:uncharacterized protein LOC130948905 [Arachis stenosperma]